MNSRLSFGPKHKLAVKGSPEDILGKLKEGWTELETAKGGTILVNGAAVHYLEPWDREPGAVEDENLSQPPGTDAICSSD